METDPLLSAAATRPTRMAAVLTVSVAFLMLFLAYNSLQNYATSLLPGHLGAESLAVLYVSVCAFVFSAPHIASRLGEKWTMVVGAICYLVYMASLLHIIRAVVLAAAVVIGICWHLLGPILTQRSLGFGAAILWVAVGSYITKSASAQELGKVNGIFWGVFQFSQIFGNLGAYLVFNHLGGSQSLFVSFVAAGSIGVILLLFVPNLKTTDGGIIRFPFW